VGDKASCFQSNLTHRKCAKCTTIAVPAHVPNAYVGYYCAKCCPVCSKEGRERPSKAAMERPAKGAEPEED
jgi:hypothetical protein